MRNFTVREDSIVCPICKKGLDGEAAITKVSDDKTSVSFVHSTCEINASNAVANPNQMNIEI